MSSNIDDYPNNGSDFDPRYWERVIEDQRLTLTNDRKIYERVEPLVKRLIAEPNSENYGHLRQCMYEELNKQNISFHCSKCYGDTRRERARDLLLTVLVEDVTEYYAENMGCKLPKAYKRPGRDQQLMDYVKIIQSLKNSKPVVERTEINPFIVGDSIKVIRGDSGYFTTCEILTVVGVDNGGSVQVSKDGITPLSNGYWYTVARFELVSNTSEVSTSTIGEINMTIFAQIKAAKSNVNALTDSITDDQIFEEIVRLEAEVEKYSKTKAQPKAIKDKVTSLQNEIAELVKFSDDRTK